MTLKNTLIRLGFLCLIAAAAAPVAYGDPIRFEVKEFKSGSFSASWIHGGTGGAMTRDGVTYYGGGPLYYGLSGSVLADRDLSNGVLSFTGGTIDARTLGKTGSLLGLFDLGQDLEIAVVGGALEATGPEGRPAGFLHTVFRQGGTEEEVSFFFAPFAFAAANAFDDGSLMEVTLWGNNTLDFQSGVPVRDSRNRIGADLRLLGTPQPEPGTLVLFGCAAGGFFLLRRWRCKTA